MRILGLFLGGLLLTSCGHEGESERSVENGLTSATGVERKIAWDGYVYAAQGAPPSAIQNVINRQIQSAIGALRDAEIALQNRDAMSGLEPPRWSVEEVMIVDTDHPLSPPQAMTRIRYHHEDTALVRATSASATIALPLLFGDYRARSHEIAPRCSDAPRIEADSLWFHFTPTLASCRAAMAREASAVATAASQLGASPQLTSRAEVDRLYYTVTATLTPVSAPRTTYPEYDRLWGFGTDRQKLVVYAFFGVNASDHSTDSSFVEYLRFLRALRAAYPGYRVTLTQPRDPLLDFTIDGSRFTATHEDTFAWVIDGKGFPPAATDGGTRDRLKQQVAAHHAERWIYWDLPVTVARGGESRDMTVEVRTYWGREDGSAARRDVARARYREAMRQGDVILYQGHSHFGHGPLEPSGYSTSDFPADRYQTMLLNSCLSFNYYDTAFIAMHPGGSRNLDMVVNGLAADWTLVGQSSARFVLALTDGRNRSWQEILSGMGAAPGDAATVAADPIRAVVGELDNEFDPQNGEIRVTVRP